MKRKQEGLAINSEAEEKLRELRGVAINLL